MSDKFTLITDANTRNPGDACSCASAHAVVLIHDVLPPMPDDRISRPVPEPARGYGTCKAAGMVRHSSLAKEDPDRNASSGLPDGTRRNRLVFPTSTHALMSDPTLSARCDGSQSLLGTSPILHRRGSPIKEIPRHGEPDFLVPFTAVRSVCRIMALSWLRGTSSYRLP
jgi:hypothetical protein